AAIAAEAEPQAAYHLRHAEGWLIRLGDGTEESHRRAQDAVDALWMYTGEMFEPAAGADTLAADGIAIAAAEMRPHWERRIDAALAEATLVHPAWGWMQWGGRRGRHSEHLGYLLAELQFLQRAYPGAVW